MFVAQMFNKALTDIKEKIMGTKEYKTGDIPLGSLARDSITGFEGTVVCISSWLNGCDRIGIQPRKLKDDGRPVESEYFDALQVELIKVEEHKPSTRTGGPRKDDRGM